MVAIVEASRKPWNNEAATRRNHHDTPRRLWHAVDGSMAACRGRNRDTCPGLARARRLEKVRDEALTTTAASWWRWKPLEHSSRFHKATSPTAPKHSSRNL